MPSLNSRSSRSICPAVVPPTGGDLTCVPAIDDVFLGGEELQLALGVHVEHGLQVLVLLHGLLVVQPQVGDGLVFLGDRRFHTENGIEVQNLIWSI